MYRRISDEDRTNEDEEAMKLYREASELELTDPMKAAQLYRLAFKKSKKLRDAYQSWMSLSCFITFVFLGM
jgi:hypothetical protein